MASSGLALAAPCPACAGTPGLEEALQVGVTFEQGRGAESPPPSLSMLGFWVLFGLLS